MRAALALPIALFLIVGCAGFPDTPGPGTGPFGTATPATGWTTAKARYSITQHEAVEYALRCDRETSLFLSPCRSVVDELNEIDRLAETVIDEGDGHLGRTDFGRLKGTVQQLDAVTDEMNRTLRENPL